MPLQNKKVEHDRALPMQVSGMAIFGFNFSNLHLHERQKEGEEGGRKICYRIINVPAIFRDPKIY